VSQPQGSDLDPSNVISRERRVACTETYWTGCQQNCMCGGSDICTGASQQGPTSTGGACDASQASNFFQKRKGFKGRVKSLQRPLLWFESVSQRRHAIVLLPTSAMSSVLLTAPTPNHLLELSTNPLATAFPVLDPRTSGTFRMCNQQYLHGLQQRVSAPPWSVEAPTLVIRNSMWLRN
jgi:hypothetical protein